MKRINKDGKKIKFDIKYIYDKNGKRIDELLKEGYLCYIEKLKTR